ncbi:MAG: 30S ribosomal protein S9 [Thermoguttaceae bacterium]|jgi:small subunit ribosomal protein S9|nr:30S ribosomal protein S9 [Thermoguttaceae bacterium]MBQ6615808.1 30S ribosomal protein S9 [Thermoguttaceae bacterium]MBR5160866.1 30S ribosomal protein S9 [Thermoguttaceae bacterium]
MADRVVIEGNGLNDALGTGRRKSSIARARVRAGKGQISINKRSLNDFFKIEQHVNAVMAPLLATEKAESVDVIIRVEGGGITGQADACKLAIARALKAFDPETEQVLREKSLLTRDGREKERKKYGLRKARRATQFSKR